MADFSISDVAAMAGPTTDYSLDDVKAARQEPKVGTKAPIKRGGTGGGLSNGAIAAALPTAAAPTQSLAGAAKEGAGNFVYGAAKGLADPVYGASQLALHGANSAVKAFGSNALQGPTTAYDDFLSQIERQYQADTPGSVAAGLGRVAGNLAMPVKGAQLLKAESALPRAINAVGTGAVVGAAQPVYGAGEPTLSNLVTGDQPNDYWSSKGLQVGVGAGAGGALSVGGSALGSLYNGVRPLVSPSSAAGDILLNGVRKSAGEAGDLSGLAGDPDALVARLRAAQSLVPGSLPTTAQVAGIPQLVMAEKVLKNNPNYRTAFEERAIANNQARLSALRDVAGTPEALDAAIEARRQLTGPLYDAASSVIHPINDDLQSILDRPSAQAAMARGQKLAAENNEALGIVPGTPAQPAQQVASSVLGADGQPVMTLQGAQPGTPSTMDGRTLQYLKMGIDDLQKVGLQKGMGSHEAAALDQTRNDLDNWLVNNSPAFKDANGAYAKASVPVDTMRAGQQLYGDLSGGTLNAAGDIAPALSQFRTRYAAALKNSPYGIDPAAQSTLDGIQADLQRETVSNSIRSPGSDTYFNSQAPNWLSAKLFGEGLDGKSNFSRAAGGLLGLVSPEPVAGASVGIMGAQKLGAFAGNRVNSALQDAMLDPQTFAQMLAEAAQRSRLQSQGGGLLGGALPRAGAIGADEATTGLLGNGQ